MKTLTILFMILLMVSGLQAQLVVEENQAINPGTALHLDFDFADNILVRKWDKSEVAVKATVNINDNADNEKFRFEVKRSNQTLHIISKVDDLDKMACKTIIIESGDTTIINGMGANLQLDFEVYLPADQKLKLETINGDLNVTDLTGPLELSTINGDIDLYIDENRKADLELETINGTMYTNMDLQVKDREGSMCKVGGDIHTKLNGGGNLIHLSTINGTMYLRQK